MKKKLILRLTAIRLSIAGIITARPSIARLTAGLVCIVISLGTTACGRKGALTLPKQELTAQKLAPHGSAAPSYTVPTASV